MAKGSRIDRRTGTVSASGIGPAAAGGAGGISRRSVVVGGAVVGAVAGLSRFSIVRAQPAALKVGVLLPRSGIQAGIGQQCQEGVEIAPPILADLGYPELEIMNADTESDVQIARAQAEKLINDGAELLIGAFDSGASTAIAQVAEQRGIPFLINIAAAPAITEQGYKYVFRNFPTALKILSDAFANQLEIFEAMGQAPSSVVFLHVNDTFGTAMAGGIGAIMPKFDMPYTIAETIAYDPKARDLSVEIARSKASGAEALLVVSRLNDAILLTRELVKQRWTPDAVMSMGPGWYEDPYLKTLGPLGDGPISFVPWMDPQKPLSPVVVEAYNAQYPDSNINTNQIFTFEALQIAADVFQRAGATDPESLVEALKATDITNNISIGPGVQFDEKGQNAGLGDAAIQNRDGKTPVVAPAMAAEAEPVYPMPPYNERG